MDGSAAKALSYQAPTGNWDEMMRDPCLSLIIEEIKDLSGTNRRRQGALPVIENERIGGWIGRVKVTTFDGPYSFVEE
jgi:hypothetical protein